MAHIGFKITNHSRTDALGLVKIQLKVNGKPYSFDDPAYEGMQLWYFPALQFVHGHKEFSGLPKRLKAISDKSATLELIAYVYYKKWSHDRKEVLRGKKYFSPVKRWSFSQKYNRWIPELTSPKQLFPSEADWTIFDK